MLTDRLLASYFGSVSDALRASNRQFGRALENFFATVAIRLTLARDARLEVNTYLAADFNVFSYIDPDETCLSNLIAELLSPTGRHGQGDVFLRLFAKRLGCEAWLQGQMPQVFREEPVTYPPTSLGFLDVVIEANSFGIGIENKPFAYEQPDQLKRYRSHLEHKYPRRFCLVYLSGRGTPPATLSTDERHSLETAGRFRMLTYRVGIVEWLRECQKECKADKIRWLLRDFAAYIVSTFNEDDLFPGVDDVAV
jgi:hypothetical protein